jgi:hypothetical protein
MEKFTKEQLQGLIKDNKLNIHIKSINNVTKDDYPAIENYILNEMMTPESKQWLDTQDVELNVYLY